MIEPHRRLFDCLDRRRRRQQRPTQEDHRNAKDTGSGDLSVGCHTSAVLGDDDLDGMLHQERMFVGFRIGSTTQDIGCAWDGKRRIDRLDGANEILMLRSLHERAEFLASKREEHATRFVAQRTRRLGRVDDFDPTIACDWRPGWAMQRDQWDTDFGRRAYGVGRDLRCIRMRRIDEHVDPFGGQVTSQAVNAAESADPHLDRLPRGRGSAACERKRHNEIGTVCQPFRQAPRFRGSTKYKDAPHVAP